MEATLTFSTGGCASDSDATGSRTVSSLAVIVVVTPAQALRCQ
jgi:hypothetical protein